MRGLRSVFTAAVVAVATGGCSAATDQHLATLSTGEVTALLTNWGLPSLAAALAAEHVDGETLAFAERGDFPQEAYAVGGADAAAVRPHHWKRFWRRLDELRDAREGNVEPRQLHRHEAAGEASRQRTAGTSTRRRQLSDDAPWAGYSVVHVKRNSSAVVLGSQGDVAMYRADDDGDGASVNVMAAGGLHVGAATDDGAGTSEGLAVNGQWLPPADTLVTAEEIMVQSMGAAILRNQEALKEFLDPQLALWLRAGDVSPDGASTWMDHRGRSHHAGSDAITCAGVDVDEDTGAVVFGEGDSSYCNVPELNISPNPMPQVTISVWVRLESYTNQNGWLITHDNGGCDRSILMHDSRWGSDSTTGIGYMGLGAGCTATTASTMGVAPLHEWLHVVGVWNADAGNASMYANLVSQHFEESGETGGRANLNIGRHPTAANHYVNCTVAEVKVYTRALSTAEVEQLHVAWDPALLLWLEATDYNPMLPGEWTDRRGYGVDSSFQSPYTVEVANLTKTHDGKIWLDQNWLSYLRVDGLDIGPSAYTHLTVSIWIRLNSYRNNRGWVVHTDNGGYDRSIILHDDRFGKTSGVGYTALGVGKTYSSDAGVTPLDEWVHIVGVWSEGGASHLYRNGEAFSDVVDATDNSDGYAYLQVGGWANSDTDHTADAMFDSIRVYGRALGELEVQALFKEQSKQYLLAL